MGWVASRTLTPDQGFSAFGGRLRDLAGGRSAVGEGLHEPRLAVGLRAGADQVERVGAGAGNR